MRSSPRLPSRRHAAPPRERFVTALFLAPRAPLTLPLLEPFWKLVAALGPAVARVVLIDRSGEGEGASRLLPGVERISGDAERAEAELLAELVGGLPSAERRVVAVATAELAAWADDEIAEVDDYAARVVAQFAATATRTAGESGESTAHGAVLASDERLADLAALGLWPATADGPAFAPFDLSALRRLRDLDVAPGDVTADLVAGLGGIRGLLARAGATRRPRLAVDRLELPARAAADTPVRLAVEGWIVGLPPVRRLVLAVGDRRYPFAVDLERADVAGRVPFLPDTRCGFRFAGRFGPFPSGRHEVVIERLDGRRLRRLGRIEARAAPVAPTRGATGVLEVSKCEIRAVEGRQVLALAGALEGTEGVHALRLEIDGRRIVDIDRRHFVHRPDAGDGERCVWQIEETVELNAGRSEIRVTARRDQREVGEWSASLAVPEVPATPVQLSCDEIERLARDSPAAVWGALRLAGSARGAAADCEVELQVDGEQAGVTALDERDEFVLRAVPSPGRESRLELRLMRHGELLARGPRATIRPRRIAVPEGWPLAIETVLAALGPPAATLSELSASDLARLLAEDAGSDLGALDDALRELSRCAQAAALRPGRLAPEPPSRVSRPLRVLFASWEIPWSGHGGGTCMVNLLRHLGARHEITVLHPAEPGAEGLSDEVRPYVKEIVSVPRGWQAPTRLAPFGTPERYLWTFSPELRGALAAELHSARFDIANLEYEGLCLHAPKTAALPSLFVFHELISFAKLAELASAVVSERDAGTRLAELIGALRFDAVAIPDRFPRLATLTEPEALHLLPFLTGRELAVLPIPVDLERFTSASRQATAREPASFVFVGTFRHPPNLAAAEELVAEIAPRLRARLPHSVVRLVGADPPPGLVDRAAAAGVEMLGWVDDLASLLARSTAFLAPLRHGAGMRVKLLEAMVAGCPVVTTALGMSGIAAKPNEEFILADDADAFVAAAVALATAPGRGEAMAHSARALVERDHDIAAQAERRERIWAAMLAERGAS